MSRMSTGSALCRLPLFALPAVLALTLLLPAPIPAADATAPAPEASPQTVQSFWTQTRRRPCGN